MSDDSDMLDPIRYRHKNKHGDDDEDSEFWLAIAGKSAVTLVTHPMDYARTLIQLGFEPLEPVASHTLFRNPVMRLPGVFAYMGYLKKTDGFFGLYRGIHANMAHRMLNDLVLVSITSRLPPIPSFDEDQVHASEEEKIFNFIRRQIQESTAQIAALFVAYPLRVITVRMMAQFIGNETKYISIIDSFREIIKDEGVVGLWSGFLPRAYGEIVRICLAGTIAFCINNYIVEDTAVRGYISMTSSFLASSITYPFGLVSTVMSVSGAPIAAGNPPRMANYKSWTHCWRHLTKLEQIKRGSSLFWRYHHPYVVAKGVPMIVPVDFSVVSELD